MRATIGILIASLILSGCTTLKPIETSPEELQRRIVEEQLLSPGDKVRIVTSDGTTHKLTSKQIDLENRTVGDTKQQIPIDEILAVETKEFSAGKTALLAGGAWLIYGLMAAVAAAATVGL